MGTTAANYSPSGNGSSYRENMGAVPGLKPPQPSPAARSLKSHHGNYLCAWDDGTARLANQVQEREHWTPLDVGGGKIMLRLHHDNYLCAWNDDTVKFADHVKEWGHWTLQLQQNKRRGSFPV
jgi:hypothetical protein